MKLQGGEDDVVDFVPFSQIDQLNAQPGVRAQDFPIQETMFIILNVTKPPLNDLNVRQALNYATDKDAIIQSVFFGQAQPMNAPIPLGTYVDTESPGYPYNLDKAKALMAASSVPNGFTLPMIVPNNNQDRINTSIILKDEWAKIGVNVDIQQVDPATWRAAYHGEGNFMSTPTAWTNDMNDPTEIVNYAMRGGDGLRLVCVLDALQQPRSERQDHRGRPRTGSDRPPGRLRCHSADLSERCAAGLHRQPRGDRRVAQQRQWFLHRRTVVLPL